MLRSQLFRHEDTQFNVVIMEVYPNESDDDSFCIKWYVECGKQSSRQNTISVPYHDEGLASLRPDLDTVPNNHFYAAIAREAMNTVCTEASSSEPGVIEILMMHQESADPGSKIKWHTHVKSFNPTAWAKAT